MKNIKYIYLKNNKIKTLNLDPKDKKQQARPTRIESTLLLDTICIF